MRVAVDTGGTFTDLVLEHPDGTVTIHKSPTTPQDPIQGILNVLGVAADAHAWELRDFLGGIDMFIYGTTHSLNALLTVRTARTALLTTRGHRDVLVLREGGREHFNVREHYPQPYVPRALTFEIPERIDAAGKVVRPLDEEAAAEVVRELGRLEVEAVAVCLLWSIVNPAHELRLGELLDELLPGVSRTLSHQLNPSPREYRRASSAAIDASLKPLMTRHLADARRRLQESGFTGRLLMVTSSGGLRDLGEVADAPIHSIKSGPAMAPISGRAYAERHAGEDSTAIVVDTGGTSYDVSLVRRGRLPWTRETWIGERYLGHMTGFPSIDVKSYGAGGGSIAWIDSGKLLHVGPQSAGSMPGPACYGRGGEQPTVTDAALVLGYIDANDFLGGAMELHPELASRALDEHVGRQIGLSTVEAAAATMRLVTEHMARAVEDTSVSQGVDVRSAVLVAGGGASGLNAVAVARRLGVERVLIPDVAAVLSAAGALKSDVAAHFSETRHTSTKRFDFEGVRELLQRLRERCEAFVERAGADGPSSIEFTVEGHYPSEVYDLETVIRDPELRAPEDVERLREAFHAAHEELFAVVDERAPVEFVTWHARVSCRVAGADESAADTSVDATPQEQTASRQAYFPEDGWVDTPVHALASMPIDEPVSGPAIVSSPVTTVVIDPASTVRRLEDGTLSIEFARAPEREVASTGAARAQS